MRLDRLDLTRYGRFTDARLEFPAPPPGAPDLHVIFGANEAGKSTLFAAWLDLLYGIPPRTRYDFRHSGPTMQIGARLTTTAGVLEVVRVKRNGQTLLDPHGAPLPEATMQAALAGLGRDGYAAMFSLDDDTLEQGGDSILASHGDLGEMLFAASAGLAGLGPQLDGIRKELDGFHKVRAHKTVLKAAKDRLLDLDRARRDLDVSASAVQKLHRDATAAEKAWDDARQAESATRRLLDQVQAALAVLPQQARLARLRAALAPLAGLPDATDADERELHDITQLQRELAGQMTTRAEAIARLEGRRAALARDPAILPLADPIAGAEGLQPLHIAALTDLPRRRDKLAEVTADIDRLMRALDLPGPAVGHAVQPPLMARLRALVSRRDVAAQARQQAQDEAAKAEDRLKQARAKMGDPAPAQDLQSLSHLVARLRATDPEAVLTRAGQDCAARNGDLATALLALAPWRGTAEDLATMTVPAPWQIARWDDDAQATRQALADATHALARARSAHDAVQTGDPAPGAPSLTQAAEARRLREAAWAAHLASMTPITAAAFETALRLDDRTTLHLAEAMVQARLEAEGQATRARLQAEMAAAEAEWLARQTDRQAHEQALAACAAGLGLAGAGLPDLRRWLDLRQRALTALQARDQALAALTRAETARTEACNLLAAALSLPGDMGFPRLWAEAQARLDTADRQREARQHLAELQDDLALRQTAVDKALHDLAAWQDDWCAACTGTPLAAMDAHGPGLAATLNDLDRLTQTENERADLAGRIAKMEGNSLAFREAAAAVFAALALPMDTPWDGIAARLTAAQQAERDHQQIAADLAVALAAQTADQTRTDALTARHQTLGQRLGWSGTGALADHLAACLQATRLRRDSAELETELSHTPAPDRDAETLAAEAADLRDRLDLARSETEGLFAALTTARGAVQAVGGDDAVARIVAERANLLHDLQEQARRHLAQRFALTALEQGLRRYRDSHRSAMLARASDAFRHLSCGAYSGLAAQPEGTTEVLVAIPAQGGAKLATDLSKGTRFQLYLALRIAGYHELAKSRPPVPFIADDILETFDDDRAGQAFALLGDMSRTGQVIYLTHHRHLCDIALATCPGARVTDLSTL